MGEVIQFISKSDRERARLIRQAQAIYDSIFPPVHRAGERRDKAAQGHAAGVTNAHRSDENLPA
jgi:type II secretory pathway component PulL